MGDRVRLQVKTVVDPETWQDVGIGGVGVQIPTIIEDADGNVIDIKTNPNTNKNELLVNLEGHQCPQNSTVEQLAINGVFTGSGWQDTIDYGVLSINVVSDQNSATNGLDVQWSNDGINVTDHDYFTILANTPKTFTFGPAERYFRLVYTNGSLATSTFHLTSLLRRVYVKPSSHRISDSIVGQDDAELVKSVITGLRDDGTFGNTILDNENRIQVSSQPYLYGIAESAIAGHSSLLKFGTRTSIAANTQSLVWEGTNALYTYLTSAEQLKVSSSSAQDGAGGTGILTLTLVGLDGNFNEITETVTMNGITAVTTTNTFIRIFRAYGATSGTSMTNVGNINITNNAGTNQLVYIPAGDGQTLMTMWTVPAGKVAYMTQITASNDSGKGARFSLYTRLNDGGTIYPWAIKYRAYLVGGNNVIPFNIPFKIPAKTDIEIRFTTPTAAGTTAGGATFELWYESV